MNTGPHLERPSESRRPRHIPTLMLAALVCVNACSDVDGVLTRPAKLAFLVGPTSTSAGAPINLQVVVEDSLGLVVAGAVDSIALAITTDSSGAKLTGTTLATAVAGVAVFSNIRINKAGNGYTLKASAAGLIDATSGMFTVAASAANSLVFTVQPATTLAHLPIHPVITVVDSFNNTVLTSSAAVTLTIGANPVGGKLSGGATLTAVNGVATFTDLSIDSVGSGFTLAAAAADLAGATSQAFDIKPSFTFLNALWAYTCGLAGGRGYCWGYNSSGQLGSGSTSYSSPPVAVSGGLRFAQVSTDDNHTCGLTLGGVAYCWGDNFYGGLGKGDTVSSPAPALVAGALVFSQVSAGTWHTCGVTAGSLYCWGWNSSGQLGDSSTTTRLSPVAVSGGLTWSSVAAGLYSTCGLASSGSAYCWGDSSGTARKVPTAVPGGLTFSMVKAGAYHWCGVTPSGAAYCWGLNASGQLGNGTTVSSSFSPVPVSGGLAFAAIFPGGRHTCGITLSGSSYCWGTGLDGELGNGAAASSSVPVAVSGSLQFVSFALGERYTCALTSGGAVYCWGYNYQGQLGDGTQTSSLIPLLVIY
jgi:alpha-tubulin suppressor-like RCC1 family protein